MCDFLKKYLISLYIYIFIQTTKRASICTDFIYIFLIIKKKASIGF